MDDIPDNQRTGKLTIDVGACQHGPVLNLSMLLQLHDRIRILAGNGRTYMLVRTARGGLQLMAEAAGT